MSEDGLIEAVEDTDHPPRFFGVQWHPERFDHPFGLAIFEAFVGACGVYDLCDERQLV